MQDLVRDVAEVDDVTFDELVVRRAGLDRVGVDVVAGRGQRVEQLVIEDVAGIHEVLPFHGRETRTVERAAHRRGVREVGRGLRVRVAVAELVERADMIEVMVRRDGREGLVEEVARRFREADEAEAGVDEHRPVATANQPHVATQERVHMLLVEMPGAVVHLRAGEPFPGRIHDWRCYRRALASSSTRRAMVSAHRWASAKYCSMRRALHRSGRLVSGRSESAVASSDHGATSSFTSERGGRGST